LSFLLMFLLVPFSHIKSMNRQKKIPKNIAEYLRNQGHITFLEGNKFKCKECNNIRKDRTNHALRHVENCCGITARKEGSGFTLNKFSSNPPNKIRLTDEVYLKKGHIEELDVYNPKKKCKEKKYKCAYCFREGSWCHKKGHLAHYHNVDVEKGINDQGFSKLKNVASKVSEKYQKNVNKNNYFPMQVNPFTVFQNIPTYAYPYQINQNDRLRPLNPPAPLIPMLASRGMLQSKDPVNRLNDDKEKPAASNVLNPTVTILALKNVVNKKTRKKTVAVTKHLQGQGYIELLDDNKFTCKSCGKKSDEFRAMGHVENCYGVTVEKEKGKFVIIKFSAKPPKNIRLTKGDSLKKGHIAKEYKVFNSKKKRNEEKFICAYCLKTFGASNRKNHLVNCHNIDLERSINEQDYEKVKDVSPEVKRKYEKDENTHLFDQFKQFSVSQSNRSSQNNQNNKLYQLLTPSTPVTPILTRPTFQNIPNQGQQESSRFFNNNFSSLTPLTPMPAIITIQNQKQKKILGKRTLQQEQPFPEDNDLFQEKKKRKKEIVVNLENIPDFSTKSPLEHFPFDNIFLENDNDDFPLNGFNFGQQQGNQDTTNGNVEYDYGNDLQQNDFFNDNFLDDSSPGNFNFDQNLF
ncbi:hypothetical protein ACFLYA_02830, partial [Candidatus Dependentiae bacterium]